MEVSDHHCAPGNIRKRAKCFPPLQKLLSSACCLFILVVKMCLLFSSFCRYQKKSKGKKGEKTRKDKSLRDEGGEWFAFVWSVFPLITFSLPVSSSGFLKQTSWCSDRCHKYTDISTCTAASAAKIPHLLLHRVTVVYAVLMKVSLPQFRNTRDATGDVEYYVYFT